MSRQGFSVEKTMHLGPAHVARIGHIDLIAACERLWLGAVQDKPFSRGVNVLARWIVRNRHRDLSAVPPFDDGGRIERILAGVDMPDDETVEALHQAMAMDVNWPDLGLGLPSVQSFAAMPPRQGSSAARAPHACGGAPSPDRFAPSHDPAAALPAMGALGGPLPSGPICFATLAGGPDALFILTFSAGVAVALDETTAVAARRAIDEGLARLRAARAAVTGEAA